MERLIRYGSVEQIPYYNCSGRSYEEWLETGLKRPLVGWVTLIFGIIVEILYIPSIYIMFKKNLVKYSCYKIIVLLGVTDMGATSVCSIISGYLFIKGAVFCTNQTLIYVSGCCAIACWCGACSATFFLVINRYGDVLYPRISELCFRERRTYFFIILSVIYITLVFFFTPSILFNSVIMAWVEDPFVIEKPSMEIVQWYRNHVQTTNNWIFISSICILYTVYCMLIEKAQCGHKSKSSRQVFIQSTIICVFNTFSAMTYNALQFITPTPFIVLMAELAWSIVHGCPAFIYVMMNKTIQNELKIMFRLKKDTVNFAPSLSAINKINSLTM